MTTSPTLTELRHHALRHHLPTDEAALAATPTWVAGRVDRYAALAALGPVEVFTEPDPYQAATRRAVPANCWGQADWANARRLVYVDPAKCGTRAAAELVVAHEVGHLRWPTAGHTARFFRHVQTLLDTAEVTADLAVPC